jgi:diguanylate cyclase (GGDEF)-like protein
MDVQIPQVPAVSMLRLRPLTPDGYRLLRYLSVAVVLIAGGASAWALSSTLKQRADGMTRYVRVDAWAVQQLEYELQQFRSRFARHVAGEPQMTAKNVRDQLAAVRATLPLLQQGDHPQEFRLLVDVDGTAAAVRGAVTEVAAVLGERDEFAGDLARLRRVEERLAEPASRLRQLAVDVAHVRGELQDGDLANVRWLVDVNRWLVIGFSAVAVFFVALLIREAVDARRAEAVARENERRSRYLAEHDPLTGLPNRLKFNQALADTLARAAATGDAVALLILDLDGFSAVNDTFGHQAGDGLLMAVTERLAAATTAGEILVRLGSDEFALICRGGAEPVDPSAVAERLRRTFERPFVLRDHAVQMTASMGAACFPADCDDLATLLKAADLALQAARAEGRGHHRLFAAAMLTELRQRRDLEDDLRAAIAAGAIEVFFQPQVDLKDGRCTGAEALARWRHPERGPISPGVFIPLAEKTGLISALGRLVLDVACREALSWPAEAAGGVVAVNISPAQFAYDDLAAEVGAVLTATGLPAARLELEITEGVLMRDRRAAIDTLGRLRALGVKLALDDFGTGYSSLSYLKHFPMDKLKIDQSFVRGSAESADDRMIVGTIVGLASGLRLNSIAEGIETADHLRLLIALGCREGQGYYFAKPMPPAEFRAWLLSRSAEGPVRAVAVAG